jgi:hypothetical protein
MQAVKSLAKQQKQQTASGKYPARNINIVPTHKALLPKIFESSTILITTIFRTVIFP